ncbi:MAG: flagellin [Acidimicrobiales bacterium]
MSIDSVLPIITTPSVLSSSMLNDLGHDQSSIATLQNELATGSAVTVASDNPSQAANILQLQAGVTRAHQYATNASDGVSWLTLANSTIGSAMTVLDQVESAVEGLTGDEASGNGSAVTGVSTVVKGALGQLLDLANTQYAGQALFSGTGTSARAYDTTTGLYVGAGTPPTRTVAPGNSIAVSVTGTDIFGSTGPTGLLSKAAVTPAHPTTPAHPGLGILQQMVVTLDKGTATALARVGTTLLGKLQTAMSTVDAQAGTLGADQIAMQGFSSEATDSVTALEQELGDAQDVTMAQALTNLQLQENAYQAAMYVTSQLDGMSLMSYLG